MQEEVCLGVARLLKPLLRMESDVWVQDPTQELMDKRCLYYKELDSFSFPCELEIGAILFTESF